MFTNRVSKIFIVLLVLGAVLVTASFVTRFATVPTADRSYDSIEQVRGLPDSASGYEEIEALRLQRSASPLTADSSYEQVEQVRLARNRIVDRSYDSIEAIRLQR